MEQPLQETRDTQTFVTHLECTETGEFHDADRPHNLSAAGKPLYVRYDLVAAKRSVTRDDLVRRPPDLWRYRELLPVRRAEHIVSLGETMTPLIRAAKLERDFGGGPVFIKDEGRMPTGSFKARGMCVAVSMCKAFGLTRLALPTAGNAGAAAAAYASRAGMECFVFCPRDALQATIRETALQGAKVYAVDGFINDCGRVVAEGAAEMGWFDLSTLKEPYRVEGKKTMGIELAEQLGWTLPDVILYPTGGGTGLIGMWKAFDEMQAMGWIGAERPRMVAVQTTGCAPIVRAFEADADHAEPWPAPDTIVHGVRVPKPIGDFLILRAIRESDGFAVAVEDAAVLAMRDIVARREGIHLCPEGAATAAAYEIALKDGRIGQNESVVLFNCGNGLKTPMPPVDRVLDITGPVDYGAL